jgi:hypothetical protein
MKTLHFSIAINAPREKVWNRMLELDGYKVWTAEFAEGSYYEGSWERGEKIKFLSPEGGGLTSVIAENKPLEFISIKHLGYINDGIEDTESPEIKAWAPLFENYTFSANNGVTEVQIDMDVTPDFEECMQQSWPKALANLKTICE